MVHVSPYPFVLNIRYISLGHPRNGVPILLNVITYSVFSKTSLPPPGSVQVQRNLVNPLSPFFAIAQSTAQGRAKSNSYTAGPQPLIQDGNGADPLIQPPSAWAFYWRTGWPRVGQDSGQIDCCGAAKPEGSPGIPEGTAKDRLVVEVTLFTWCPLFWRIMVLLRTQNQTLLEESYAEIKLYRSYLRDPTTNMWKHVLPGSGNLINDR
ncbi:uncharacterized protein LACBIDRAFT_310674 [Laccaria bicolor S238N-H82]|uniref:Predicted protein n=1 Tax=Laccaria bicolor (strain S238N-H82 / ATCC MYA-4686) TaxID=486041 RepID=B0DUV3_LACBS|nr:uncharacterized protein LACBIDRAFT_310674 [Laccaria bicolor S238N-H82]EDR01677.1 predicted protein [Laccaria bicolor S238N-H82]|eukprot:XP_001887753.1 predicted protein [Laccaria bicolor S238N-H82]